MSQIALHRFFYLNKLCWLLTTRMKYKRSHRSELLYSHTVYFTIHLCHSDVNRSFRMYMVNEFLVQEGHRNWEIRDCYDLLQVVLKTFFILTLFNNIYLGKVHIFFPNIYFFTLNRFLLILIDPECWILHVNKSRCNINIHWFQWEVQFVFYNIRHFVVVFPVFLKEFRSNSFSTIGSWIRKNYPCRSFLWCHECLWFTQRILKIQLNLGATNSKVRFTLKSLQVDGILILFELIHSEGTFL